MHEGDVYCRFRVRVEEMKQSREIIRQLIDRIPAGEVNTYGDEAVHIPPKSETYGSIEGLIHHFELINEEFCAFKILNYLARFWMGNAPQKHESHIGLLDDQVGKKRGDHFLAADILSRVIRVHVRIH